MNIDDFFAGITDSRLLDLLLDFFTQETDNDGSVAKSNYTELLYSTGVLSICLDQIHERGIMAFRSSERYNTNFLEAIEFFQPGYAEKVKLILADDQYTEEELDDVMVNYLDVFQSEMLSQVRSKRKEFVPYLDRMILLL
ncbi:MAG: hypothetical protein R8G66_05720 [Cytophagales bacterium]|nr:hypothetical protein [Cytophagales bacterium]